MESRVSPRRPIDGPQLLPLKHHLIAALLGYKDLGDSLDLHMFHQSGQKAPDLLRSGVVRPGGGQFHLLRGLGGAPMSTSSPSWSWLSSLAGRCWGCGLDCLG